MRRDKRYFCTTCQEIIPAEEKGEHEHRDEFDERTRLIPAVDCVCGRTVLCSVATNHCDCGERFSKDGYRLRRDAPTI